MVFDVSLASDNTNPGARPKAPDLTPYSELVHNPVLATAVLDRIGDSLSADEREPYALLSMVDARIVVLSGSQIEIEATYGDPTVALGIADAWALESIDQINGIYRQSVDESLRNEFRKNWMPHQLSTLTVRPSSKLDRTRPAERVEPAHYRDHWNDESHRSSAGAARGGSVRGALLDRIHATGCDRSGGAGAHRRHRSRRQWRHRTGCSQTSGVWADS